MTRKKPSARSRTRAAKPRTRKRTTPDACDAAPPSAKELAWWTSTDARTKEPPTAIGARAEERAVGALEAAGYAIVDRNWRCRVGELDIVARHGSILVFVEVRSRADDDHGSAVEAIGWDKRKQVSRVAEVYLALVRPRFEECRFDIVAITGDELEIIQDAWRT